jgi:hypothetical protein
MSFGTKNEGDTMRIRRILLTAGCVGAIALGTIVPAKAQYYYPRPPDYGYDYPPPDYRYGYGWTWNDCPPSWTVQGGNCAPYKGPVGGGWRTWNGCPPHYTVQGESVNCIDDISSQSLRQIPSGPHLPPPLASPPPELLARADEVIE